MLHEAIWYNAGWAYGGIYDTLEKELVAYREMPPKFAAVFSSDVLPGVYSDLSLGISTRFTSGSRSAFRDYSGVMSFGRIHLAE